MKIISKIGASALLAAGIATSAFGQIQVAGTLQVNLDMVSLPVGPISYVTNTGAMGDIFQSVTNTPGAGAPQFLGPQVVAVGGNGTHGVLFDLNCCLAHVDTNGNPVYAPATITGSPTSSGGTFQGFSAEAWVFEATIPDDNPVISWGTRGNCSPNQVSCAYGANSSYGGLAMWCNDHGWGAGGSPAAGQWHHLVWTLDASGNENLYADGALKANYTGVNPSPDAANNILIGASHANTAGSMAGAVFGGCIVGRVRVEDGILTASQVATNYLLEVGTFTNGTPVFLTSKPLHRWSFTNAAAADATGSTVLDIGTANGTTNAVNAIIRNNGGTTTFSGSQLTLGGGSSATAPYVDFTNSLVSVLSTNNGGTDKATFEAWVTESSASSWTPLFDIGSTSVGKVTGPGGSFSGVDYIGFIANPNGGSANQSAIGFQNGNYGFASQFPGHQMHVAVTWDDDAGVITVYENGVEVGQTLVTNRMAGVQDVNNWLGRSAWSGDANFNGSVAEFRIFNRIVTPAEILNDFQVGPTVVGSVLKWSGNVSGDWDINGTANWLVGSTPVKYSDNTTVQFDDSLTGTTNVNITTVVQPAVLTVNNTASNYVFSGSGSISGSVGLTKTGNGTLTINNLNNYTGVTVLQGGTVIVTNLVNGGTASPIGAASSAAANISFAGGTLSYQGVPASINRGYSVTANSTFDVQGNLTIAGPITASGGTFTKSGAAQLTIISTNYNKLSAGGGGRAFGVANGTVVLDGTLGQTNTVTGETWVGFDQAHGASLVLSNTVMTNSSWFAIGRGNGTGGFSSSAALYNTYYTCGNVSLGYANGIAGNNQTVSLSLNGNSKLNDIGGTGFNLSESVGSVSTVTVSDNSTVYTLNRTLLGLQGGATGNLIIQNNGSWTNVQWTSLGVPGNGNMTLKDNAIFRGQNDFNVTDTAGSSSTPSTGTLTIANNATLVIPTLYVGKSAYCTGTINQSGGTVVNSGGNEWRIGGNVSLAANETGIWNFSGGTINVSDNFQVGAYGVGYFNQSGGIANVGGWVDSGRFAGGTGYINVSGGTFNSQSTGNIFFIGEAGTGTLNVSGTGTVTCAGNNGGNGLGLGWTATGVGTLNLTNGNVIVTNNLVIANNATASGTVNLYGGTLAAAQVKTTAGSSFINFYGGALEAMPNANANFLSGLSSATVYSGGAFFDTGTNVITIAQDLNDGGSGNVTKLGAGTLTLSGNQYYTGPLTVTAGKLILPAAGLAFGASGLSVADGAELDVQVTGSGLEISPASATLGATTGSVLDIDLGTFGNASAAPLNVSGAFAANGTTTVNILGGDLTIGEFPLIKYGTRAGSGNFVLGSLPPGVVAALVTNVPNGSIDLNVTAVNILLWTGLNGGNWDVGTTVDWSNILNSTASTYGQGSSVIFDDSAPGSNIVNVTTTVTPSSVVFSNNALPYTLIGNGKLSGSTGLGLFGLGSVTLSTTNNNYSGTTLVAGGTLLAGVANALSTNSAVVVDNATLDILTNNETVKTLTASNAVIAGTTGMLVGTNYTLENSFVNVPLAGNATLTTAGTNGATESVAVANNNSYTGRTVIGGGTLYATNLANGGSPSSIGASSSNPANLVFAGGTLSYGGPSASIDRGYTVTANSTLDTENNLAINGAVAATGGNFTKAGPASLIISNTSMNQLSAGGGGAALGVANGALVLDGSSGQTNKVTGEIWVGFDQAHNATLILTNTVLTNSSWFAVGRGNGTGGFTSTVSLNNSTVSAGNVSLGYDNGIAGNNQAVSVTLNNNSRFINTGGSFNFTESTGSSASLTINDTSWVSSSSRILIGMANGSTGTVVVADSGAITNSGWVSIGDPGTGIVTLKNNAVWQALTDFNITDIAANSATPSYGELDVQDNAVVRINTLYVGKGSTSAANSYCTGVINQSGGLVIGVAGGDWRIGGNNTTTYDPTVNGTYNLSGGYVQSPGNLQVGTGGNGEWNQTGGTVVVPAYPSIGRYPSSIGQADISGGSFNQTNVNTYMVVGEQGTGTLNITNAGHVVAAGGVNIGSTSTGIGTVNLGVGGTLSVTHVFMGNSSASSTFNFNGGLLQALPGSYLTFMGGATALGSAIVQQYGAIIDSGANSIGISQPLLDGGTGGGLTKLGSGSLDLSGANSYSGLTTVSNGTLFVDGVVAGPVTVAGGTLSGAGTISGAVTVNPAGTLAPGDAIGILTVNNTLTLDGATVARVSRSSGVVTNDQVAGLTQVNYGGSLTVNNVGTDQLQVGDTFQLFSAGTYAGSFASVTLPSPYIWTNHLALNGTIQVIGVGVNTNPTNIVASVSGGNLTLSWPADHTGWSLQAQTNSLSTGLSNNWVTIPGSTTTNQVTIPLNSLNGSVFFRMKF